MPSRIVKRITAQADLPRLFSVLAEELPAADLQSLLMTVFQARAAKLSERDLRRQVERGVLAPSRVDARLFNQFDRIAFETAEAFEAIELSPVGPLGLSRVLGGIDQNSLLTTIRNCEVLGDSTLALALECSRRRKEAARNGDPAPVRLAASHRVVRLQPFVKAGHVPHFRLFSLVTAGRDSGSNAFEIQHTGEHLRFYLRLFRALNRQGYRLTDPLVEFSDTGVTRDLLASQGISPADLRDSIRGHNPEGSQRFLAERGVSLPMAIEDPARELPGLPSKSLLSRLKTTLVDRMQAEYPEARFRFNLARLEGMNYYTGLCFRISPMRPSGERDALADGGLTDWTARLLENRKERLLTTGIGAELICALYRQPA